MALLVTAATAICEEDAGWAGQYLDEMERLDIKFVMHFDRCSHKTKERFLDSGRCAGYTEQDNKRLEFNEQHKQGILDLIKANLGGPESVVPGSEWALTLDIDELLDGNAVEMLGRLFKPELGFNHHCITLQNWHAWEYPNMIRVGPAFNSQRRNKLLNLKSNISWRYKDKITNGPTAYNRKRVKIHWKYDLHMVHIGLMTHELRLFHKKRWDRIYSKAVGRNPYGFWNYCLETNPADPIILEGHTHLNHLDLEKLNGRIQTEVLPAYHG